MGRLNSVKSHDRLPEIQSDLLSGKTQNQVAMKYGLSQAAVSRYVQTHRSDLARIAYEETSVTDLFGRLHEIAQHAQDVRRVARLGGTPAAQMKAISIEMHVLNDLLERYGVTDTTELEISGHITELLKVLREFVTKNPENATGLMDLLESRNELRELADILRNN